MVDLSQTQLGPKDRWGWTTITLIVWLHCVSSRGTTSVDCRISLWGYQGLGRRVSDYCSPLLELMAPSSLAVQPGLFQPQR